MFSPTLLTPDISIPKVLLMNELSNLVLHLISKPNQITKHNSHQNKQTIKNHPQTTVQKIPCLVPVWGVLLFVWGAYRANNEIWIRPCAGCGVSSSHLHEHRCTQHDISWQTFGSTSIPADASSKVSVTEKQILSRPLYFPLQTTLPYTISATAFLLFLISSCPLSPFKAASPHSCSQSTEPAARISFQILMGSKLDLIAFTSTVRTPVSEGQTQNNRLRRNTCFAS